MLDLNDRDKEIIEKGTKALINELGYSGFLKYISRVQVYDGGYFRAQEEVYTGVDVDNDNTRLV